MGAAADIFVGKDALKYQVPGHGAACVCSSSPRHNRRTDSVSVPSVAEDVHSGFGVRTEVTQQLLCRYV